MKKNTSFTHRLIACMASRYFFLAVLGLFVLQALWIALSGLYPMAFDEDFHLGIIRLYADHTGPFWASQPAGADSFGAIARDPSYLFHYLMSFPYKLLTVLTDNQSAQVIVLRILNIGLFAFGLVLWRLLLLKTGTSKAVVHFCLLLLVLVPVVPLLAAQLNYDNLLMPLVALTLLLAAAVIDGFKQKHVDAHAILLLAGVVMMAALVKYAFLPIMLAVFLCVVWAAYRSRLSGKTMVRLFKKSWTHLVPAQRWALVLAVAVMGVLFIERYGVNLVRYHTPVPDCAQVISVEQCKKYGPWGRNYRIMNDPTINNNSVATYAADWLHGMWLRSFFAVDGPTTGFQTRAPLLLPGISAVVLVIVSLAALLYKGRAVWTRYNHTVLVLSVSATVLYVAALWLNGLETFLRLGQSVAINGRYLIMVAPIIFVVSTLAVNEVLGKRKVLKVAVAFVAVLCFAWGGGAATYVLRSNNAWYWHNPTVRQVNGSVRDFFGPITPGYHTPTKFLWRN